MRRRLVIAENKRDKQARVKALEVIHGFGSTGKVPLVGCCDCFKIE